MLVSPQCRNHFQNSPVTSEFPAQRSSNAENVSIWWHHHGLNHFKYGNQSIVLCHTKNWGGYHNAMSHLKCGRKWDSILIRRIFGSIHKFSRSFNLFSTFYLSSVFIRFWYTYICFDLNYRTVVMASIQMLLVQRILDMAYFRHYYYYGHLLSITKLYNPEETCCYARPASVIINSNTGLKCWPCRGRTPPCHSQALFTKYDDTTTFA